ncbi:MAG: hypothetical protein ACYC5Y_05080 [Symbiobacteriia bacterium]
MAVVKTKIVFDVSPEFRERWLQLCRAQNLTQAEMFRRLVSGQQPQKGAPRMTEQIGNAVMVHEDNGTYRIIGEVEDWSDVRASVADSEVEVEPGDALAGWEPYTRIYRLRYPGGDVLTYFVAEEAPHATLAPGTVVRFAHSLGTEIRVIEAVESIPVGGPMLVYRSRDGIEGRLSVAWVAEEVDTDVNLDELNELRAGAFGITHPDGRMTYYRTRDNGGAPVNLAALLARHADGGNVAIAEYDDSMTARRAELGRFDVHRENGVLHIHRA